MSFRTKITGLSLMATTVGLALAFTVFVLQAWIGDRFNLAQERVALAQSAASHASAALKAGRRDLAREAIADFERTTDLRSATFYTIEGAPFLHWGAGRTGADSLQFVSLSGATSAYHSGVLEVHAPVLAGEEHLGELVMVSGQAGVDANLRRNSALGFALFFLCTAISGFLAHWLSGRVLTPLNRLAAGMEEVRNTKDLSVLVEPTTTDEFGWLTMRFNALLQDLAANDAALHRALGELTEARDAADAANVMKSQFLANMSHEIRTPLNGVLGMAQVMAQNPMEPAQRGRLDVIRQSGESLLAILNDLLDLSKIEAGKLEIEEEPFDLAELALGAHAAFTSIANAKGVSFNLEITDAARGVWRGDSVRVRQILYNLISNALKFTHEGEVRVAIDRSPQADHDGLHVSVTDTGIGIPQDKLATLFDKFVQADSSMTRRFGGTGLGLSICLQLAELMGGGITAHSRDGEGSRFDVQLPLTWLSPEVQAAIPCPSADSGARAPDADGPVLRVLAAEDNPTNQIVLKTVLQSVGIEPVVVDNGRDAVQAWVDGDFDLILMDIQMPLLDGVAATREIRAIEAARGGTPTPIVALSANAMRHQVAEYLAAGMDDHLAKPIQLEKLYAVLQSCLDRRSEQTGKVAAA